jgi:hypothetical protein
VIGIVEGGKTVDVVMKLNIPHLRRSDLWKRFALQGAEPGRRTR